MSVRCPACGGHRRRGEVFCRPCYFELPPHMRATVWRYDPGAVLKAARWLRERLEVREAA